MTFAYSSAVDLTDYSLEDDNADDDTWHVLMSPDDVKVLSLEQLDDFYRLGVISDDTLVWQPKMEGWTALGTVLGADSAGESEAEEDESWHVLMGPDEVKVLSLEQLDDFYRLGLIDDHTMVWQPDLSGWTKLGIVAGTAAEPAPVRQPSPAPTAVYVPPARLAAPFKPATPAARVAPATVQITSTPPLALSIPPQRPESGAGRFLIGVAAVAGLLVSLHQNDVLFSAARTVKQETAYLSAEARVLGGPAFGTVRAVTALMDAHPVDRSPLRLPLLAAQPAPIAEAPSAAAPVAAEARTEASSAAAAPQAPSASEPVAAAKPMPAPAPAALRPSAEPAKADEKAARSSTEKPEADEAAKLEAGKPVTKDVLKAHMLEALKGGGKAAPKPAAAAPERPSAKAKKSASSSEVIPGNSTPKKKSRRKSDDYDPLNGSL